jgi:hypothetical protein
VVDEGRDSSADRAYRRGFRDRGNKREDYAVDLLREARASLDDPARVDRILLELGRLYNPLTDRPIAEVSTRRKVAELLSGSQAEEAGRLLDTLLDSYHPPLPG